MHTLLGIANNIGFHVGDRLDIETVFCAAFVPPSTSVCPEIEKGRCCIGNARNCFLPTERGNSVPPFSLHYVANSDSVSISRIFRSMFRVP